MTKKITKRMHHGDRGIALIDLRVGEMGLVWHHRPRDAGIDGQIEARDPATGEVFNRSILVQSKAQESRFPENLRETGRFIIPAGRLTSTTG